MKILVTGAAGFIGFHTTARLLSDGHQVTGIDNLNAHTDPDLKSARLEQLTGRPGFAFHKLELTDSQALGQLLAKGEYDRVIHLAAQAGVRKSIDDPGLYAQSNLVGFANLLEACRQVATPHLVYASSSSVYGASREIPFNEHRDADHPVSLYAATKRANELMAHSYAELFQLPVTGLRFFTAYGPWGRPDMALFLFTRAILEGRPIDVFSYGRHQRDFTYIDDIVEGVVKVTAGVATPDPRWDANHPDPAASSAPYRVYNIGNSQPVVLDDFIRALEAKLGKKAIRNEMPRQPGDVQDSWADCSDLARDFGYRPSTSLEEGISRFVDWYLAHYKT